MKWRFFTCGFDKLHGRTVWSSAAEERDSSFLERVVNDLSVPISPERVGKILACARDRCNRVAHMVKAGWAGAGVGLRHDYALAPGWFCAFSFQAVWMVFCRTSTKRSVITDQSYLRAVAAAAAS